MMDRGWEADEVGSRTIGNQGGTGGGGQTFETVGEAGGVERLTEIN